MKRLACLGILCVSVVGCYQGIDFELEEQASEDEAGPEDEGEPSDPDGGEEGSEPSTSAFSPVSRLTDRQWRRTVAAAFERDESELDAIVLPADSTDGIFLTNAVDELGTFDDYISASEAAGALLAPGLVDACDWLGDTHGCVVAELAGPMTVLLHRPPSSAQLDAVTAMMLDAIMRGQPVEQVVGAGLSRALLDPLFLFRVEVPGEYYGDSVYELDSQDLAARLSLAITDGPPDAQLYAAGQDQSLLVPTLLEEEVDRILALPGAREMIWRFVRSWLGVRNEGGPLAEAMEKETRLFVESILYDDAVPLGELFTANYSYIDASLAELYGVPAPAVDWERYEFPANAQRMGVLTHASFLSSNGAHERDLAWIFRGRIVVERLFCLPMPDPPPGAVEMADEVPVRETDPVCGACHGTLDPVGRLFHAYDSHGALFEGDEVEEVVGALETGSDIDGTYANVLELNAAMVESGTVDHCFTKMWFQFLVDRKPTGQDLTSVDEALLVLSQTRSTRQMLATLLTSTAMTKVYIEDYQAP